MIDDLWEPTSDYDDQMDAIRLGYQSEADSYCVHGTFVGNWAGPDYMCGPCEMGVSDEEWAHGKARAELRDARVRALAPKVRPLIEALNAAARVDPESDETHRLARRVGKYIGWRVRPPYEFVDISKEVADA